MSAFTLDELRATMRAGVGVDDAVDLDGDILDTPFVELGYDSLALLEIITKVQQRSGVRIPDDAVEDLETPRGLLDFVNTQVKVA